LSCNPKALAALVLFAVVRAAWAAPELASLGADHFRDSASVTEDAARDAAVISTEPGYSERALGAMWHDEYLRAIIDHKSGRKSFEIDVMVSYGGGFRAYGQGVLKLPAGPKTLTAIPLATQRAACQGEECQYTETVALPLDEATLRQMAERDAPTAHALFDFRLTAKRGRYYQGTISSAEAAGLLARVEAYSNAPPAPPPAPKPAVTAPPPPQRLPFGISGLAVAASPELPNRAGVLVVSVAPGSVAAKAGMITGDIIDRIDAHPVKTPADLETAVASVAAGTSAVVHVFRGTAEMTLPARF
jgi:hypothetical protein